MDYAKRKKDTKQIGNILLVGGFDPSGGAGVLVDYYVIRSLGAVACVCPTALTVQTHKKFWGYKPLENKEFEDILKAAVESMIEVDAIKIGMIPRLEQVYILLNTIANLKVPVVLDPVVLSTSGGYLVDDLTVYKELMSVASLVTPNWIEARRLFGLESKDLNKWEEISAKSGVAILLKGGHRSGRVVEDILFYNGLSYSWKRSRLEGCFRGTGCFLSSAITFYLGCGYDLPSAVDKAENVITGALKKSVLLCDEVYLPVYIHFRRYSSL